MLKKVDIHTHILPKHLPKFKEKYGYGGFIQLNHHHSCRAQMVRDDGKFFREIEHNCWDPRVRTEEASRHGVSVQVLSTVPVLFSYWAKPEHGWDISRYLNDHMASVVSEHPKQFVGLGTLPMQNPEFAIQELHRCVKELGLAGVQIGSHVNGINLCDASLFPVFEEAQKLGASIFIHPWDMLAETRMQKYWLPWLVGMPAELALAICSMIFGGVFERLPNLKIAFAHGGGAFPGTIGRIEHGHQVRPDLCGVDNPYPPSKYLGRFYVDSLVHQTQALQTIIDLFGVDKVALGTDYPFPLGEEIPGKLIESLPNLSDKMRYKLLVGNALEWLGKQESDFE